MRIELEFNDSHNKLKVFNFGIDNSLKLNPMLGGFVSCLTLFFLSFLKEVRRHFLATKNRCFHGGGEFSVPRGCDDLIIIVGSILIVHDGIRCRSMGRNL